MKLDKSEKKVIKALSFYESKSLDTLCREAEMEKHEMKDVLREFIDLGMITSTPGFEYRLARNEFTKKVANENK